MRTAVWKPAVIDDKRVPYSVKVQLALVPGRGLAKEQQVFHPDGVILT